MDIEANLKTYLGQRTPTTRYTSFDYCYNHFQLHRERGALSELVVGPNLQLSCLHLAFYLASWGMLRASSALLQRSVKHYVPVIEVIASSPPAIWNVDAHCYTRGNCSLFRDGSAEIGRPCPMARPTFWSRRSCWAYSGAFRPSTLTSRRASAHGRSARRRLCASRSSTKIIRM